MNGWTPIITLLVGLGSFIGAGVWVGNVQSIAQTNKVELEYRRPLVEQIPPIKSSLYKLESNQAKILCRLGDTTFCEGN